MKGKRFLAVLMTALILSTTGVCTTSVSAYQLENEVVVSNSNGEYKTGNGTFLYSEIDNGLAVSVYNYEGASKNVVIPDEINGKPVTTIWFALAENKAIDSITLPKHLTKISRIGFGEANHVKEFKISNENTTFKTVDGVLYSKDMSVLIAYPTNKDNTSFTILSTVKEISVNAFAQNKNLVNVVFNNGVTTIGDFAFMGCEKLTAVEVPDTVNKMGACVFSSCKELTKAKVSKNSPVTGNTFKSCTKLKDVTIPEGVENIGVYAFTDCSSLETIKLPSTLKSIENFAFGATAIKKITVPKSVTSIGNHALGYGPAFNDKISDFVVCGYKDTAAQSYAIENGFAFAGVNAENYLVSLNKEKLTLGVNESYTLKPTLSPSGTTTYSWRSSNTAIATVNSNGKITAKAEGKTHIIVETADGATASCEITVKKAPTSVKLNKTAITLGIGEQFDFNSSLSDGSASYSTVYSSSNPNVVNVKSGGGLATGKATGTATITVKTYNGKTATCKVTVKKAPTSISLNKTSVTLGENGDSVDLNSKMPSGEASRVVTYKSSNINVATVNGSGVVTTKSKGTAVITATTYNGKSTTCKITVKQAPNSVSLNKESLKLGVGEVFDFNSSIPSGTVSYNRTFYSYNESILSIQKAGGLATAKSPGRTSIKVTTHNGNVAICDIEVGKAPTKLSLNKASATLGVGEKIDLNSKLPLGEASRVVTYKSGNTAIATVDGKGVVTAKKTGTVTITATTYNGKTATCKITIKNAPTSVSLNKTSATLGVGEIIDLNSKIPTGQASRVVTYTSSDNNIATVDGSGVVTAKKTGTVTITASTYNGKTATCKITVKKSPTSISLNKSRATIKIGETIDLNSKLPTGEASRVVTYTSGNTKVATVDGNGVVTGKKAGKVIITATTYNGKSTTCTITVK